LHNEFMALDCSDAFTTDQVNVIIVKLYSYGKLFNIL